MSIRLLTCAVVCSVLSACGAGGGAGVADEPDVLTLAQSFENATQAQPIVASASGVSGQLTFEDSVSFDASLTRSSPDTITIRAYPDETEGFVVNLLYRGESVPFVPDWLDEDGNQFVAVNDATNEEAYLWIYDGTWEDLTLGQSTYQYVARVGASLYDPNALISDRTFAALGFETEQLPISGSIDYSGLANGDFVVSGLPRSRFEADAGLTVSFGDTSTVTGQFNNLRIDGDTFDDVILINFTNFEGGDFSAELSVDAQSCTPDCVALSSGGMSGRFFGPNATEVGGTLSMAGTTSLGGDFTALGVWAAGSD